MDISVSRLNKRMALQLPAEFPLGLVFVVGEVKNLSFCGDGVTASEFYIEEHGHRLHCRLTSRAATETHISDGDLIRAGGHLAFEPAHAGYYLLGRDVEVLSEDRPDTSPLSQIIVDNVERSFAAQLVPAEIPQWVEQLAPPELRVELKRLSPEPDSSPILGADRQQIASAEPDMTYPAEEPAFASLNDDLIDFLSEAMDRQEEVELTPELLAEFRQVPNNSVPSEQDLDALKELEAALFMTIMREDSPSEVVSLEQEGEAAYPDDAWSVEGSENDLAQTKDGSSGPKYEPIETSSAAKPRQNISNELEKSDHKEVTRAPANSNSAHLATSLTRPVASAVRTDAAAAGQRQQLVVPWYVVALVMAFVLLFGAAFVIVALNSTALPLPFSLP